jgi:hypothetical protein
MKQFLESYLKVLKEARDSAETPLDIDLKSEDPQVSKWASENYAFFQSLLPKKKSKPEELQLGQIWTTRAIPDSPVKPGPFGPKPILLTVVETDEAECLLRGVPICGQWQFAGMEDMVIGSEDSPLGFRFMLQLWNEVPLLEDSLDDFLGEIPPKLFAAVQTVLDWLRGGKIEYHYLGTHMESEDDTPWVMFPIIYWSFKDNVTGEIHRVRLGQRIRHPKDPRAEFRKLEIEDIEYLSVPVLQKVAAEEREISIEDVKEEMVKIKQEIIDIKAEQHNQNKLLGKVLEELRLIREERQDIRTGNPWEDWAKVERTPSKEFRGWYKRN